MAADIPSGFIDTIEVGTVPYSLKDTSARELIQALTNRVTSLEASLTSLESTTSSHTATLSSLDQRITNNTSGIQTALNRATNAMRETLLWTNPNPTASFAAQTISQYSGSSTSFDFDDFDLFRMEFIQATTSPSNKTAVYVVKNGTTPIMVPVYVVSETQYSRLYVRYITAQNNVFEVSVGSVKAVNATKPTSSNDILVPQNIYGLKRIEQMLFTG